MRVSVSELREDATIANFGGTSSPTPRTFTRRPSRHPNLGLEKGIHILPNRAIGFYYPTSVGNKPHLQPLGVRPRLWPVPTHRGPSPPIAALPWMQIRAYVEETSVRISSLVEDPRWCALNLGHHRQRRVHPAFRR